MTFSAADITRLRYGHHVPRFTLNAVPRVAVATAQINMAAFAYPIAELTVDNTSADWVTKGQRGRYFTIGTTPLGDDVTHGVLRKASAANTLYMDAKQVGEPGYARDIQIESAEDYYVTVWKYRSPWGVLSSIRNAVFYKAWDVPYTNQGSNPDPIVRLGRHRAAHVDRATGLLRLTFTVDPYLFAGRALSSVLWAIDGGALVGGYALTDTTIEVDFEAGFYEVTCDVTDNKGKTRQGYRYVWANSWDPTSIYAPFDWRFVVESARAVQDRQGETADLVLTGDFSGGELFPGQMFFVTENPTWDGGELDDMDSVVTEHVWYATEDAVTTGRGVRRVSLKLAGPVKRAAGVPMAVQMMQEKGSPKRWTEVSPTLSNPVGAFYYLAAHHAPYLIDGHDFDFDTTLLTLRRHIYNFATRTLGEQARELGEMTLCNLGSNCAGTTRLVRHPLYFDNDDRNALPTRWTWTPDDMVGELDVPQTYLPAVGQTFGYAFSYNGGATSEPYASLAPGYAQSQAGGQAQMTPFSVPWLGTRDLTQNQVNLIAGMAHAMSNKRSGDKGFRAKGNLDVAEPCDLDEWHVGNIAASYDPLGVGWLNQRALPLRVRRVWNKPGGVLKEIDPEFEVESFGYPGVTVPINRGGANTWRTNTWVPGQFDPYQPKIPDLGYDFSLFLAWNDLLRIARSDNFGAPLTAWQRFLNTTAVVDVALNLTSDYFTVGPTEPLEAYILAYDADTGALSLYLADDLFALSPGLALLESWGGGIVNPADSFRLHARVLTDTGTADYVVVGWKNQAGVQIDRSTDGGSTWDGQFYVGASTPNDLDTLNMPLGIALNNGRCIVTAKDGTTDSDGDFIYFVYYSPDKTSGFSKISNPTDWTVVQSALALRGAGGLTGLVPLRKKGAPEPDNALEAVTFDIGTYPDYLIEGGPDLNGEKTDVFYPAQGEMAYAFNTDMNFIKSVNVIVTVDLTAPYTVQSVSFWRVASIAGPYTGREGERKVELLDDNDNVIATHTAIETSETPPSDFTDDTFTVTAADLNYDGEVDVYQVRVTYTNTWATGLSGGDAYAYLDDIDITATLVEYDEERAVHSLSVGTGVYTRRNSLNRVPANTYGFAVSSVDDDDVSAVVLDSANNRVYLINSSDGGASWSPVRGLTGITGAARAGSALILFGTNRLEGSADAGATSFNLLGDWVSAVGGVGTIRGVKGVS